jgi:hypothetical protein
MMENPFRDEKKRKIVIQNNVSKYYMNGVQNDFHLMRELRNHNPNSKLILIR